MGNRGRHRKKSKNEKPMFNRLTINMYNEIKKCIETYYLSNDAGMPWRIVEDIKNQNNILSYKYLAQKLLIE